MKYNILLIANDTYYKLLAVCLKSICFRCDMDKISRIFIADLGLSADNKAKLACLSAKINFISGETAQVETKKIHSKEWVDAVSKKTQILLQVVEGNNIPVVMMDSDMIVTGDFSDVIDTAFDIQLCKRSTPLYRPDGLVVEYIASFFVVNTVNGKQFIERWIGRMEERIAGNLFPPHETPAMVEILATTQNMNIGYLPDTVISSENIYIPGITKIIHAKGRDKNDVISIFRFANVKRLPLRKSLYLFDGSEKVFFTLAFFAKKIYNPYAVKKTIKSIAKRILKRGKSR